MAIHGALLWYLLSQHLKAPAPFTGQECSRDWHCLAKPFSVSAVKWDQAAQASFYRLSYLPRMMQVISHKGRPVGNLVLLMGSITEHVADDLDRWRRSLGTCTPHCCYAVAECHQASLIWHDFQPLAHPACNCFLCSTRAGKQQRHASRTHATFPGTSAIVFLMSLTIPITCRNEHGERSGIRLISCSKGTNAPN